MSVELTVADLQEFTLKETEVIELLQMSRGNVRVLVEGVDKVDGCFPLVPLVRNVVNYYRSRHVGKDDIIKARLRYERLKGDDLELQIETRKKKLLPLKVVQERWENGMLNFRSRMLAVPMRFAPLVLPKTVEEARQMLTAEITSALQELSQVTYETNVDETIKEIFPLPDETKSDTASAASGPLVEELSEGEDGDALPSNPPPVDATAEVDGDGVV